MNIKDKFPNEDSLKQYIRDNLSTFVSKINLEVGHLEKTYKAAKKSVLVSSVLTFISILLLVLLFNFSGSTGLVPAAFVVVVSLVLVYKFVRKIISANRIIKQFNLSLNKQVFSLVFSLFNILDKISIEKLLDKALDKLEMSQLITEPHNRVHIDDTFVGLVEDKQFFVAEANVKHVTGSGKNRREKKIFKGYLIAYDLNIKLKGKTFLSTEGDKNGFGNQSFWDMFGDKGAKVTELEWNDFENLLHVVATDPVEARYVLSTDFMNDLYDWWHTKKQNIRISFIDNRMYMLFPNDKIRFGNTVNSISDTEVQEYIESIALPLLHVLHLVEDVKQQFNHGQ